jgi:hypothetical protein
MEFRGAALLCGLALGVLLGASEAASESCTLTKPDLAKTNCTTDPLVQGHLDNIDALLSTIGSAIATDPQIEQYITEYLAVFRLCEGTKKSAPLRKKYFEKILPKIAFGIKAGAFPKFLAAGSGVDRLSFFGQPPPPGPMEFVLPVIAGLRHPEGHALTGTIMTTSTTLVPLRQILVYFGLDGSATVQSVSDTSAAVILPPEGVSHIDYMAAPIGCVDVDEPVSMTATLTVVGTKPDYCRFDGAFCSDCLRHTTDCALFEEDCRSTKRATCLKFWMQDLACACKTPFTDP